MSDQDYLKAVRAEMALKIAREDLKEARNEIAALNHRITELTRVLWAKEDMLDRIVGDEPVDYEHDR